MGMLGQTPLCLSSDNQEARPHNREGHPRTEPEVYPSTTAKLTPRVPECCTILKGYWCSQAELFALPLPLSRCDTLDFLSLLGGWRVLALTAPILSQWRALACSSWSSATVSVRFGSFWATPVCYCPPHWLLSCVFCLLCFLSCS